MRSSRLWVQTWTGRQFWPLDARTEDVFIEDIAWQLAQQNRWKGATNVPFSIAQHSVIVSRLCDPEFALQGLLHDAPEAYLGDIAGPLKAALPDFVGAEEALWKVIAKRFNVPVEFHPSVKRADLISLHTESRDLLQPPPVEWRSELPPPMEERIKPWGPSQSACEFWMRYKELTR